MLRAKRRRTRTHDINGNPIFNTMNSTPLQSAYVNVNNNQKQLQDCRCTSCGNPNSGCTCLYSSIKQNSFKIKNFPLPEFDGVYKVSEPIFNELDLRIILASILFKPTKLGIITILSLRPFPTTRSTIVPT